MTRNAWIAFLENNAALFESFYVLDQVPPDGAALANYQEKAEAKGFEILLVRVKDTPSNWEVNRFYFVYDNQQRMSQVSGLNFKPMPGDGHCLYRAVAFHFTSDWKRRTDYTKTPAHPLTPQKLRELVATHIEKNGNRFADFFPHTDLASYVKGIRGDAWGGNAEQIAMMEILDCPIVVLHKNKIRNELDISQVNHLNQSPCFIHYNGENHYDTFCLDSQDDPREILERIRTGTVILNDPLYVQLYYVHENKQVDFIPLKNKLEFAENALALLNRGLSVMLSYDQYQQVIYEHIDHTQGGEASCLAVEEEWFNVRLDAELLAVLGNQTAPDEQFLDFWKTLCRIDRRHESPLPTSSSYTNLTTFYQNHRRPLQRLQAKIDHLNLIDNGLSATDAGIRRSF